MLTRPFKIAAAALLLCSGLAWADLEGRVKAVDSTSGSVTIDFGTASDTVKARDVFVIMHDGKPLGECMVTAVKKGEATLFPKADFKGTAKNGDVARFVRHAETPKEDYTSMDQNEKQALDRVRAFKSFGQSVKVTRELGFALGHVVFEDTPPAGAILTGLDITCDSGASNGRIKSIQPLFQSLEGPLKGSVHGKPDKVTRRIEARHGYAIGAVQVVGGLEVNGVNVTFMRLVNGGLNPHDSYTSDWVGTRGDEKTGAVGGDGSLVIGIFGRDDGVNKWSVVHGLGLVTMPSGGTFVPTATPTAASKPTPMPTGAQLPRKTR